MSEKISLIRQSLTVQLILWVGVILLGSISVWAYANIRYHETNAMGHMVEEADRLGNTIKLGAHYAMMLNARDDINQIILNIGRRPDIRIIRIYNKEGRIKFSNLAEEVENSTDIRAEACIICHRGESPLETVPLGERTRVLKVGESERLLGIISPIYNEPGCSEASCHYHPAGKKVLGALDVVFSLSRMDNEIRSHKEGIIALALFSFLGVASFITVFFFFFVNLPIRNLIQTTRMIGSGLYRNPDGTNRKDEIGQLALSIQQMGREIAEKQETLNKQREEYQRLFEQVPCCITVQDRELRIIQFNQEIDRRFNPTPGEFCYRAYKGRRDRCEECPVLQTFRDGENHVGEEVVLNRDGTESRWFVRTSPIRTAAGEVCAVMEISLDITEAKRLEQEILKSERKYHGIFNNIPNAVFVVDGENLEILDCNESASALYGFDGKSMVHQSFLDLFEEAEQGSYAGRLPSSRVLNQVRHITRRGETIFVDMHVSPTEYSERRALLVVASDITKRLLAEQQLIQTSKMATLGEMSAGVAHELNQPLSVIKTAGNYLLRKVQKGEDISPDILRTMAEEIDAYVDRAAKIINHLRDFGRKAEVTKQPVSVNDALSRAHEMFDQQLRLRKIRVVKELAEDLPPVLADANRLEQVFINLLVNARDAIEQKVERTGRRDLDKEIRLKTRCEKGWVFIEVADTGIGVPEHLRGKIFEPFFTTKKVGQGTGLGLSISYGIVQDYGGRIEVKSEMDEGSTFVVRFPAAE
ncbi:MAG TPA: PAS domain S-box protein [Syntrophobacteraceae bacterium]|nr:PAS domain S-box protein [Syntrophobacteraceae bacterium]